MAGMALVSGVAGEHRDRRIEAAANCPYPLAGDVSINGVWMSDQPWSVSNLVQTYDFNNAELTSSFAFTVGDKRVNLKVVTFASRTAPSIVLQQVIARPSAAMTLGLRSIIEIAGVRGSVKARRTDTPGEDKPACDGSMLWESEGQISTCGIALTTTINVPDAQSSVKQWDATGPLVTEYQIKARKGGAVSLNQMTSMVPSVTHQKPEEEAVRRVARAKKTGFDILRERNRLAWADLWRGRIVVTGAGQRHQALIDAAFFYLMTSTHEASAAATSIFGLATWHDYHYYYGHVMWDLDAFCIPPLIVLQPGAARAILDFRRDGVAAAKRTARLSSRNGLQFPWEVGPCTREEAAPGDGSAAAHEDHVSLHVARAFALYADLTGDEHFLANHAWPVLKGVSDWIVSRSVETERGVEILRANGPAEVPEPPDNDAFTNMVSAQIIRRAIRAAEQLGHAVPMGWPRVAADMYIPQRSDGIIATHDDFRIDEPKGATPSVLAGFFPYHHPVTDAERQRTLEFYLSHWPDYVGSPMLPALYPVWAAMTGNRDLALRLFEEGYGAYDHPRFHQCLEYRPDHPDSLVRAGPFFANLGGMLLGVLFGLTGLVIEDSDPAEWPKRGIVLPAGWTDIRVERMWIHGRAARLYARHGAPHAELEFL
jgi:trehalose/maltose hydrolase-like predicted phosphorylase